MKNKLHIKITVDWTALWQLQCAAYTQQKTSAF